AKSEAVRYLVSQRKLIQAKQPMIGPRNEFYHGFKDNDIYYKGAWILHTMRSVIDNDSLWFAALKGFCLQYRHSIVKTEDVIAYFNNSTGRNWDTFFKQYLYTATLPVLDIKFKSIDGQSYVYYKWKNAVNGFNMPIKISTKDGEPILIIPTAKTRKIKWNSNETNLFLVSSYYLIENK
ncbi:MAG: M1 family peptidase, partial [Bacteroidia bacterium]|nr:M1 family peptidase [Bacteroidia bacterium]